MSSTVKLEGVHCEKQGRGATEEHDVARAVLLGRITRSGSRRHATRSGVCVRQIPGKADGGLSLSLSLGDGSQPASCLARDSP